MIRKRRPWNHSHLASSANGPVADVEPVQSLQKSAPFPAKAPGVVKAALPTAEGEVSPTVPSSNREREGIPRGLLCLRNACELRSSALLVLHGFEVVEVPSNNLRVHDWKNIYKRLPKSGSATKICRSIDVEDTYHGALQL